MNLFPYQEAGAKWLSERVHAVLADEMGLGKTIQAITAADILQLRRVLIICPAVARENWVREFSRFSAYMRNFRILYEDPGTDKCKSHSLVVSYERACLLAASGFFEHQHFHLMICDEAHYLKNPFAKRTQTILGTTGIHKSAKYIWALTGTPVTQHIGDLWIWLKVFGAVKQNYFGFLRQYCEIAPSNNWINPKIIGLKKGVFRVIKPAIDRLCLRRTIANVLPELPGVIREEIAVERGEVELTKDMRAKIEAETDALNLKLSDITNAQALGILEAMAISVSTLRRYLGLQKVAATIDILKNEIGIYYEKIVVFTVHKDVAAMLCKAFPLAVSITGDTPPADRQKAIDTFQSDPSVQIFIANICAAGTAVTLTAAHHVIFVEQEWSPAQNEQAISRCRRIGQTFPVHVRILTVANSIDEAVSRILRRKEKHIEQINSH